MSVVLDGDTNHAPSFIAHEVDGNVVCFGI
jgi:hypothetical protein